MSYYLKTFFKEMVLFEQLLDVIYEKVKTSKAAVKAKELQYLIIENKKRKQDFLIVCDSEFSQVAICVKPTSGENNNFSITLHNIESGKSFEDLFFYSKVLYLNKHWKKHAKYAVMTQEQRNALTKKCQEEKDLDTMFELSFYMLESMNIKLYMLDSYYVLSGLLEALGVKDNSIWNALLLATASMQKDYTEKSIKSFKSKCTAIHKSLLSSEMENAISDWTQVDRSALKGQDRNDMDNHYYALNDNANSLEFLLMTSQNHDVLVYQGDNVKAVFYASHPDYGYEQGYSDDTRFSSWTYMQEYVLQVLKLAKMSRYTLNFDYLSKGCAYLEVGKSVVYSEYPLVEECFSIDAKIY